MTRPSKVCACGHSHSQYSSTRVFDEFAISNGFVYTFPCCHDADCGCRSYKEHENPSPTD